MQTKLDSMIESLINLMIGVLVSFLRSYIVRRFCNGRPIYEVIKCLFK